MNVETNPRLEESNMRFSAWALLLVFAAACGGGEEGDSGASEADPAETAAVPAGGEGGTLHTVEMNGDGTAFWFEPEALTIAAGDRVSWVNVDGTAHNVKFYEDQIPAGAHAVLEAAMGTDVLGPLNGPFVTAVDATYEMSFAGAPAGEYNLVCFPHEALGMKMSLTVEE